MHCMSIVTAVPCLLMQLALGSRQAVCRVSCHDSRSLPEAPQTDIGRALSRPLVVICAGNVSDHTYEQARQLLQRGPPEVQQTSHWP